MAGVERAVSRAVAKSVKTGTARRTLSDFWRPADQITLPEVAIFGGGRLFARQNTSHLARPSGLNKAALDSAGLVGIPTSVTPEASCCFVNRDASAPVRGHGKDTRTVQNKAPLPRRDGWSIRPISGYLTPIDVL